MNSPLSKLEKSKFNFRYIGLCDLDSTSEKWLNYLQTVETLIRRRVLRRLIWVCAVCHVNVKKRLFLYKKKRNVIHLSAKKQFASNPD